MTIKKYPILTTAANIVGYLTVSGFLGCGEPLEKALPIEDLEATVDADRKALRFSWTDGAPISRLAMYGHCETEAEPGVVDASPGFLAWEISCPSSTCIPSGVRYGAPLEADPWGKTYSTVQLGDGEAMPLKLAKVVIGTSSSPCSLAAFADRNGADGSLESNMIEFQIVTRVEPTVPSDQR